MSYYHVHESMGDFFLFFYLRLLVKVKMGRDLSLPVVWITVKRAQSLLTHYKLHNAIP